jgi:nicotinamidase-related amidase
MLNNTALLIIDAQVNMFAEDNSVFEGEQILQKLSRLISRARTAQVPIIFVQNNGTEVDPDRPGTPGWEIHPALAPQQGDTVIQKFTPDSFHETDLQSQLEKKNIRRLVIAGMQTDYCINATARRAHALGYDVTLVKDAHSTYPGGGLTASQVIAKYNADLGELVNLEAADNISFA